MTENAMHNNADATLKHLPSVLATLVGQHQAICTSVPDARVLKKGLFENQHRIQGMSLHCGVALQYSCLWRISLDYCQQMPTLNTPHDQGSKGPHPRLAQYLGHESRCLEDRRHP